MPSIRAVVPTRQRILYSAFTEFYEHGFQGGNLQNIITKAGITKGALFHHFNGKLELGYAVVDELIEPLLMQRWLDPLNDSRDPLTEIQKSFRRFVKEDIASGAWHNGCPLNNLAQEMSPLDAGFHSRIEKLYNTWRGSFAQAISFGIAAGSVLKSVSPDRLATFVVASQMGVWGTGKSSRNEALMIEAAEALCEYLESLRIEPAKSNKVKTKKSTSKTKLSSRRNHERRIG